DEVDHEMRPVVVKALIRALGDSDVNVRDAALDALLGLEKLPSSAERALLRELGESNAGMRADAAYALGLLETISDDGIAGLVGAAQDVEKHVRTEATASIGRVGKPALAAVRAKLATVDGERRDHLRDTLRTLGEDPDKK